MIRGKCTHCRAPILWQEKQGGRFYPPLDDSGMLVRIVMVSGIPVTAHTYLVHSCIGSQEAFEESKKARDGLTPLFMPDEQSGQDEPILEPEENKKVQKWVPKRLTYKQNKDRLWLDALCRECPKCHAPTKRYCWDQRPHKAKIKAHTANPHRERHSEGFIP